MARKGHTVVYRLNEKIGLGFLLESDHIEIITIAYLTGFFPGTYEARPLGQRRSRRDSPGENCPALAEQSIPTSSRGCTG